MAKRVGDKTKESVEIKDVTLNELSRFFNGPIRIRTSRFGRLRFQMITIEDIDFFQELIKHNPPAREFVIQIIHHQLFSPKLSVDTIRNWKEKLIIRVASIWVKNNPELAEYLTENELSIESIKKIIINYMKKQLQYISRQNEALVRMMNFSYPFVGCQELESAQKLSEITKLASGFENVQRISDMVLHNPALENAQRISDMVLHNPALESAQRMSDMIGHNPALESVQRMSDMVWQNPALESAQRISDMIGHNPTLESVQRMSDMVLHNPAFENAQRMSDMIGHNPALESVQRMSDMVWQNPALESAQRISDMIVHNPTLESVQRISDMIGRNPTLESVQRVSDMIVHNPALESVQRMSDMVWQNPALESVQRMSDMIGHNPTLESAQRLGDIWTNQINASDLLLATISQYPLKEIALSQISNSDAANLSKSFMDLFSDFQENISQTNIKFPTITSELEARELFTTTNLVKSILAKEPSNEYDENEIIKDAISIETDDRLQMLLLELDPQLISMWLGAKEAINSNNPDYARHFSVSLSELFANVLQRLAPDNEIRSWSDSLDDFREGKPTSEARLRYIYREANDDSFGLTKKFISFALELMDFLISGTHKSITYKVDKQFRMILMQFELVISQLIETSQPINSLQLNSSSLNNSSVSVNSIASDLIKGKTDANICADDHDKNKFTIGLIAALPKEFAAIKSLLQNPKLYRVPGVGAGRYYLLANLPAVDGGKHYLVLAFMADTGDNMASTRATLLFEHFPEIRSIIMVGIAGGVPNHVKPEDHVRLGDVVISNKNGIVQYDLVKEERKEIIYKNPPRPPSSELLEAVGLLEAEEILCNRQWTKYIEIALEKMNILRPSDETDILTDSLDPSKVIPHPKDPNRTKNTPRIFFGPIAASNTLLKNPIKRDDLRNKFRGICDYCDERKNDIWQKYAAAVASAVTRSLIESIPTRCNT